MPDLVALGVQTPKIDTAANFQQAQSTAINQLNVQQQQEAAALEHVAQLGFGVMGGKLDGKIDPERLDTMVSLLGDSPLAAKIKANPELLRTITQGSANVVAQAQNAQQFEMAKEKFNLELQQLKDPTIVMHAGDYLANKNTGEAVGGTAPTSGIIGSSTDQQAYHILATGDPNSYEYAQAYSALSQPTTTMQSDGKGGFVQVSTPRQLPQGTRPPTYKGEAPPLAPGPLAAPTDGVPAAGNVGAPDGTAPVGATSPNGTTVTKLPGVAQNPTETQNRYATITKILDGEIPVLQQNFKALSDPWSQAAGILPGDAGRVLQTPKYKQAFDSVTASIANILYALSGASSNPGEVAKQAQVLMPHFGDDPQTQLNAFNRIKTYIEATADGTNNPEIIASTKKALEQMDFSTAGGGKSAGAPKNATNVKVIDGKTLYQLPNDPNVYQAD